jgi:hypothetical protein
VQPPHAPVWKAFHLILRKSSDDEVAELVTTTLCNSRTYTETGYEFEGLGLKVLNVVVDHLAPGQLELIVLDIS